MHCANCGQPIGEGVRFCQSCGATMPPPASAPVPPPPQAGGYDRGWTPPPPPKRNRTGLIVGSIVAAIIVLAGLGVGLFSGLRGGGDDHIDADTPVVTEITSSGDPISGVETDLAQEEGEILLEATGDVGADPFSGEVFVYTTPASTPKIFTTTTVTGGPPTTSPSATGSTAAGAVQVAAIGGDTPALYGGSKDKQLVDKEGQLDFLEKNPDKAAAFCAALNADPTFKWSGGTQIQPSQLRDYFAELTPMMLTRDTRVTNHGFKNGKPTPRQSVLQKGQMVLVDQYGVPRVRCECGNPLASPRPVAKTPKYTGTKWPDFDPTTIVVIQPTVVIINIFVVIDIDTGDSFDRPSGTEGTADTAHGGSVDTTLPGGATGGEPVLLFDNGNIMAVQPGATPPSFELTTTTRITKIATYHYVLGGLPGAGLIGLQDEDGEMYGPWDAVGTPGQGDVANAYWTVTPDDLVLPPGRYTIFDSDLSTFSQNADSGGIGMTQVYGIPLR